MKARILRISEGLPEGAMLIMIGIEDPPGVWRPKRILHKPNRRLKVGEELEVAYIDPEDPSRGLIVPF